MAYDKKGALPYPVQGAFSSLTLRVKKSLYMRREVNALKEIIEAVVMQGLALFALLAILVVLIFLAFGYLYRMNDEKRAERDRAKIEQNWAKKNREREVERELKAAWDVLKRGPKESEKDALEILLRHKDDLHVWRTIRDNVDQISYSTEAHLFACRQIERHLKQMNAGR